MTMQDRLRFRAWYKDYYIYDIQLVGADWLVSKQCNEDCFGDFFYNEYCVIEQCTGLKDKNGKLIYEGDIVEFYAQSFLDALSRKDLQRRVGKVVWNDEELKFDVVVGNEAVPNLCRETDDNQFVIIGNIHENADLLELKQND